MEKEYLEELKSYFECTGKLSSTFGDHSKVYSMTTENIYGFLRNYNLKDKNILTVGGSGDQRLNAYLLGARNVTCFDINPLVYEHIKLKDEAIKNLNFEKFINFFGIHSARYGSFYEMFDQRLYSSFKDNLDENVRYFFDYIINSKFKDSKIKSLYFDFDNYLSRLQKLNGYLTPDSYEELREIISDKPVNFINSDVRNLPSVLGNEKFDMILLSNISDYTHLMYTDGKSDLFSYRELIDQLMNYLTMYGIMQVGYIYSRYGKDSDVGNFKDNKERHQYFTTDKFNTMIVDSYFDDYEKDRVITYQKLI